MNRQTRIAQCIRDYLQKHTWTCLHLKIEDESHKHQVPKSAQTHFKLWLVSDAFISLPLVQRHRLIYSLLADEMQTGLHALALHLFTPEEWASRTESGDESPACRGGYLQ